MDNFQFYSPTEFIFGKETEAQAGEMVKKYGGKKVLLHYGGKSAANSGLLDKVKEALEDSKIEYVELGGVKPNPRDTLIYRGIDICRKEGVDFILSVGGGSCIDSSKAIALGLLRLRQGSSEGSAYRYYPDYRRRRKRRLGRFGCHKGRRLAQA